MSDPFATMPNADDAWNGCFSPAATATAPAISMGAVSARGLLKAHDDDARKLSRLTRAQLTVVDNSELAARSMSRLVGKLSKDELISDILELRYPIADRNQAIHVIHHVDGLTNSACEWCRS